MSATRQPTSQPSVALPSVQDQVFALRDMLSGLAYETRAKLAVLIRWSEAEATADNEGTSKHLDRLAWLGMEILCRDILRDVEETLRTTGAQNGGFVTVADEEGGAQ